MGFTESSAVQAPLLDLLRRLGWRHVPGSQLQRGYEDPILPGELTRALVRLNAAVEEEPVRAEEIVSTIRAIVLGAREDGLVQANQKLLEWLRGLRTHRFMGREGYDPVRLIDFDAPGVNSLIVSDEVTFGTPGQRCRFDLVLWVNGLPLVVIETKTNLTGKSTWLKGALEIHGAYEKDWPEFFVANAFSVATDGKELHYGSVRQPADTWGVWGSTTQPVPPSGWARAEQAARLLLAPAMVLRVVGDFAAYELKRRHAAPILQKILPRYPQVEAVDAIVNRVRSGRSRQGLIVQTQGSGKTIAMMYAAIRLVTDQALHNPTVIVVADRLQLVRQMYTQFKRADMPDLAVPETSAEMRQSLAKDQRGILFTTVHKFNQAGELNTRSNVIVMVDEAHRTQEGQLGKHMRAALPNATFFGFTGTPIADTERNTFKLFGDPEDPGHALNTYDSDRSIADGNTVPMRVAPRLVDFHIDRGRLDEAFNAMADEENLDDFERDVLARKAAHARTFFSNPDRVRTVCADIVEHFYTTVDPLGLKAQVVVYDRELCVAYHRELTRLLDERSADGQDRAAVVMSVDSKETDWRPYRLDDQQEEALLDEFRDLHQPLKFLIVTSKLGTGFDAPIEGVLYLDKPMKLHTLYQTITRTNRVWKNPDTGQEKSYGLIVDYVGLGDGFARAMAPANPEKAGKEVETDALLDQFEDVLATVLRHFAGIDRSLAGFEALHAAQQRLPDDSTRDWFNAQFGMLQGIWEALYPDLRLEPHRSDYRWVAAVHASIQPGDSDRALLWARLGAKTLELVHGHISDVSIRPAGSDVVIADEDTVRRLIEAGVIDDIDDEPGRVVTAAEVVDTIAARLKKRLEGPNGAHPQYQSIAERLERLKERQLTKAQDSIDYLKQLLQVATDFMAAEKAEDEAGKAGLDLLPDPNVGALTQIFEEYKPKDTPVVIGNVVKDIDGIVKQTRFDGWARTSKGDRAVRAQIRVVLKKYGLPLEGPLFDHAYAYVAENY